MQVEYLLVSQTSYIIKNLTLSLMISYVVMLKPPCPSPRRSLTLPKLGRFTDSLLSLGKACAAEIGGDGAEESPP